MTQRLVAEYNLVLMESLVIKCAENANLRFSARIDDFDATIVIKSLYHAAKKTQNERHFTGAFNELLLSVSRDETEFPPPPVVSDDGRRDYAIQSKYFDTRIGAYSKIARIVLERFLGFFRFRLRQPISATVGRRNEALLNPKWKNENGDEVGRGPGTWVSQGIPGIGPRQFGVTPLRISDKSRLERWLLQPKEPALADEFLADAQTAAFENNLRRAVLEMAIACEIATKQRIFGNSSPAALTFEFLEDKGNIKTRVMELIHSVALQVFGKSFRDEFPDEYDKIEYLFRCRNKIAHRGSTRFRDKHGIEVNLTDEMLQDWWATVTLLFDWLSKLKDP